MAVSIGCPHRVQNRLPGAVATPHLAQDDVAGSD
jgi:hypothetical protein